MKGYKVILHWGIKGRYSGFIENLEDAIKVARELAKEEGGRYLISNISDIINGEDREKIEKKFAETEEGDTFIVTSEIGLNITNTFTLVKFKELKEEI